MMNSGIKPIGTLLTWHYLAALLHVFWKVLIEASVDRSRKRKPQRKTDQWIQPAETVELVAVWLRIKSANDMGRMTGME